MLFRICYNTHPYIIIPTSALCPRARVALSHIWVRVCMTCCNSSTSYIPPELARLSGLYLVVKPFYPIAGYPLNGDGMNPTCGIYIGCTFTMHAFHSIIEVVNLNNDINFLSCLYTWVGIKKHYNWMNFCVYILIMDAVPLLDM